MPRQNPIHLAAGDALLAVDVQNDFLPGGRLAVPHGGEVVPVLNRYIHAFREKGLPVFATRDWHPSDHCSFEAQGGPWPPHCVQESEGAEFASDLQLPQNVTIVSKAHAPDQDAYSGFQATDLHEHLQSLRIRRLFVGGLATDYCVLNTIKDALDLNYTIFLLKDAVRAVNVHPEDGKSAEEEMIRRGTRPISLENIT